MERLLRHRHRSHLLIAALVGVASGFGCSRQHEPIAQRTEPPVPSLPASLPVAPNFPSEPWTFNGEAGRAVPTPHYRLHTTIVDAAYTDRLANMLESALAVYRAGCGTLDDNSLPGPPRVLNVFVYRTRGQWEVATRELLGERAGPMLAMPRGGYTIGGRVMLYDLGPRDTTVLLAHEGWHQYMQTTFRQQLPDWLDEGLATTAEGFRWEVATASGAAAMVFKPWANTERFDELRRAAGNRRLWTLDRLIASGPGSGAGSAALGNPDDPLAYYAQVWALVRFLREAEGGARAGNLAKMISDAASGRISEPSATSGGGGNGGDATVFRAYFGSIGEIEPQFAAFVGEITRPGARESVVRGESPLATTEPAVKRAESAPISVP